LVNLGVGAIVVVALLVSIVSLALAVTTSFPDVPATHPYYTAITDLASRGIIGGYKNGEFGPGDLVTRQQFAKMIVGTGGYSVSESDVCLFSDVETSDATTFYPDNFVAVCVAKGITTGNTATTFDPTGNITRYQVISMVVRTADNLRPGLLNTPPAGWTGSAGWENDSTHGANAARAEYGGLLAGLDLAALSPYGNMSRGEVAQVLHNLLGRLTPTSTTTTTVAPTTTTSSTTTSSTTTTTDAATPGATFQNPLPLGQGGMVGDWSVNVVGADIDATEEVLDYSASNPDPVGQYLLVTIRARYFGQGSSTFCTATSIKVVTILGQEFRVAGVATPDDLRREVTTPQYGEILGNLVFDVPLTRVYRLMLEKNGDSKHITRKLFEL
jgi:hypothetical protein